MPRISSCKLVLLLVLLPMTACGAIGFEHGRTSPCPPLPQYTKAEQDQAARELNVIPTSWMVSRMLDDYRLLRDQIRACR